MDSANVERKERGVDLARAQSAPEQSTWLGRCVEAIYDCRISDCLTILFGSLMELLCSCCRGGDRPGVEDVRDLRNRVEPDLVDQRAAILKQGLMRRVEETLEHISKQNGHEYLTPERRAGFLNDHAELLQKIAIMCIVHHISNEQLGIFCVTCFNRIFIGLKAKNKEGSAFLEHLHGDIEFPIRDHLSEEWGPHGGLIFGNVPPGVIADPDGFAQKAVAARGVVVEGIVRDTLNEAQVDAKTLEKRLTQWTKQGLLSHIAYELELIGITETDASISLGIREYNGRYYLKLNANNDEGFAYLCERNEVLRAQSSPFTGVLSDAESFGSLTFDAPAEMFPLNSQEQLANAKAIVSRQLAERLVAQLKQQKNREISLAEAQALFRAWENDDPGQNLIEYIATSFYDLESTEMNAENPVFHLHLEFFPGHQKGHECKLLIVSDNQIAAEHLKRTNAEQERLRSNFAGIIQNIKDHPGLCSLWFNQFSIIIPFKD